MNIFMSEMSIVESVKALDDKRLCKQILECRQIIKANDRVNAGEKSVGYSNHPVVKYYRQRRNFLVWYGLSAICEYIYRFDKTHAYFSWFMEEAHKSEFCYKNGYDVIYAEKQFSVSERYDPDYDSDDKRHINVLFRHKLERKWNADKKDPKWTNREAPIWYKNEVR